MIKQETISAIFDVTKIEDVISEFVTLKKKGVNFVGHCPFHNEKTPSFYVSPTKGIFKCFGCQKAGNAIGFIMEHEHFSYPDALRYLAKKYNIEIEEKELTPDEIEATNVKESLFLITEFAKDYFQEQLLQTDEGKSVGLNYLEKRNINKTNIEKFQIGYCPTNNKSFSNRGIKHGFKKELLEKVGLSIINNNQLVDRFSNRIIFPIQSLSGRILGFGGRTLKKGKIAKYINSPESEIYYKSKILYGIYQGKKSIVKENNCYLVEGYTDVIALHKIGIENCASSSGTSLTKEQIQLIKRLTSNITILYDGDQAGLNAAFRGIDLILEEGLSVNIIIFPEGEDPDSFTSKKSKKDVINFLKENTTDFIKLKTKIKIKEAEKNPTKKTMLAREILTSISKIPDRISRNIYIKECSSLLNIEETILSDELAVIRRNKIRANKNLQMKTKLTTEKNHVVNFNAQEKDIIRILLNYGHCDIDVKSHMDGKNRTINVAELIINDLAQDNFNFSNNTFQEILNICSNLLRENEKVKLSYFTNHSNSELSNMAISLSNIQYSLSENWKTKHQIHILTEKDNLSKAVIDSLNSFKLKKVNELIANLSHKIKKEDNIYLKKQLIKALTLRKAIAKMLNRDI